jgi:toxin ParE1/3/4
VKPLRISAPASEELAETVRWLESRRPGWGGKFFDAVLHTTTLIQAHSEIGKAHPGRHPSRKLRVLAFPYYVAYRIREHDIYVIAIAHTSRRPGYWKARL